MTIPTQLLAEIIVVAVLVATIVWCVRLDRRLSHLKGAQGEMRALITDFDRSITDAKVTVSALKEGAKLAEVELQGRVTAAQGLAEELKVLVESGNRIADRIAGVRTPTVVATAAPAAAPVAPAMAMRSEAERELVELLRRAG
jgi:hypothetical protein